VNLLIHFQERFFSFTQRLERPVVGVVTDHQQQGEALLFKALFFRS
jgi:hypothetical protein